MSLFLNSYNYFCNTQIMKDNIKFINKMVLISAIQVFSERIHKIQSDETSDIQCAANSVRPFTWVYGRFSFTRTQAVRYLNFVFFKP